MKRAMIMRTEAITMRVSAVPQARSCAPVYGDVAFAKICDGSEGLGPLNGFRFTVVRGRVVNSRGAVSPTAGAIASGAPLTIPPIAAGNTTVMVTRALVAPSA